jgi:hypothetical protein
MARCCGDDMRLPWLAAVLFAIVPTAYADPAPAIPQFAPTPQCPTQANETQKYVCDFLADEHAGPLVAPPGARVYREVWRTGFLTRWARGIIVLTIYADGRRTLHTPWHRGSYWLDPDDLSDFEATLAGSDFARLGFYNQYGDAGGNSICIDGAQTSLEAIVGGKYRIAFFDYCGVGSAGVADALDQLFLYAGGRDGVRVPFRPDHPTYRG